jgi:REP element-mobilizing transposase RayT
MADHVWNLRSQRSFSIVGRAITRAARRFRVQIVEFSVQGNHMHLIVESPSTPALSRAMQGFSVRVARGLNRMMKRRGRAFAERFDAHVLASPREARNAIAYVRNNRRKHLAQMGQIVSPSYVDEYSSVAKVIPLPSPELWLVKQAMGPPS